MKKYTLSLSLEQNISLILSKTPWQGKTLTFESSKELATCVKKLSDFYIQNPKASTPWKEPWAQIATAVYFFPLNYMRNLRVAEEGLRLGFFNDLETILDFGAGPGTASWALRDSMDTASLSFPFTHWIDTAQIPHWFDLFQTGKSSQGTNAEDFLGKNVKGSKLGVFSYSLTELEQIPSWWSQLEALMILEPSTQEDGRRLQTLRTTLIQKGFSIWAPCTHEKECPLLLNSKKDWCHDRLFFSAPDWFRKMESFLPWDNKTLTFSYLLARRKARVHPSTQQVRVIGDTLAEKGKTRQMICADERRLFLTWMKKDLEAEFIPRGSLIHWPQGAQLVSNELRVSQPLVNKSKE